MQEECKHLLDCCSMQLLEYSTVAGLVQHAYTPIHVSEWRYIHTSVQWQWNQRQCPYSGSIQSAANRHPFYPWAFTVHSPHHYFKSRALPIQHAGKHNWLLNNRFVELVVSYVFRIEICHVHIPCFACDTCKQLCVSMCVLIYVFFNLSNVTISQSS